MFKPCVVIPVYNHEQAIGRGGSGCARAAIALHPRRRRQRAGVRGVLDGLAGAAPERVTLLRHPVNRGKGSAVLTGVRYAAQAGYSHVAADRCRRPAPGRRHCALSRTGRGASARADHRLPALR